MSSFTPKYHSAFDTTDRKFNLIMRQCRQTALILLTPTQDALTVVGVAVFKGTEEQSRAVSPTTHSCHHPHSQGLDEQENTNHVIAVLHRSKSPI